MLRRRLSSSSSAVTIKAKPPYIMTTLSRSASTPYTPTKGSVRTSTQAIVTARRRLGSVVSAAMNIAGLRNMTMRRRRRAISPM